MADSQSLKVFKCPSCGAPLDPTPGMAAMKCPYCGASVVIPETLRGTGSNASASNEAPASLSDVTRLAKEGKLEEAAKIYSRITGLNHEYAMMSVKSMAGIREDEPLKPAPAKARASQPAPGPVIINTPQTGSRPGEPFVIESVPSAPRPRRRNRSCLGGIINLIVLFVILSSVFPSIWKAIPFELPAELPFEIPFLSPGESIIPVPFATEVMSFSPSSFKDPRAIQVDGNGNILVFNYNSSDVQIFDPQGNEISVIKITESDGDELNNDTMGVSRNGTIYVPGFQSILVFNENAERLREIPNGEKTFILHTLLVGADDKLYARSSSGIVRFDENGEIDLFIADETLEQISGEYPSIGALGVDTQGNIYFSGTFNKDVLKFSPDGDFISRFAGDFTSVREIVFDSYGRIYIVDFSEVKVYDADYNYIDKIDGAFWGVDFDSQNYMYAVTTNSDDVLKFEIRAPEAP